MTRLLLRTELPRKKPLITYRYIPLEFSAEHGSVNVCKETSQGSGMKTLKEFKVINPHIHM